MSKPLIALIGAGLGGSAAAALLQRAGFAVKVFEQTPAFARVGGGIHLGPNLMKIMRRVGCEDALDAMGFHPDFFTSRDGPTAEITGQTRLGELARKEYGASYLTVHRGDFHAAMQSHLEPGTVQFGKRLNRIEDDGTQVHMTFTDGTSASADLVIGADGINSRVREHLLGAEAPVYGGVVGHRAAFSPSAIKGEPFDDCCKWWRDDRNAIVYYLRGNRDEMYYVATVPQPEPATGETLAPSTREEMEVALDGYHPRLKQLIGAAKEIKKWPFYERKPLPLWSRGRLVLLGDACHPMKPHMAQGAAMAIEDAAVLARCFQEVGVTDYENAFALYAANRTERTSKVQLVSHNNTFLRRDEDPAWVYGYDAFSVPLTNPSAPADSSDAPARKE